MNDWKKALEKLIEQADEIERGAILKMSLISQRSEREGMSAAR